MTEEETNERLDVPSTGHDGMRAVKIPVNRLLNRELLNILFLDSSTF